jgi:hypothetical protein
MCAEPNLKDSLCWKLREGRGQEMADEGGLGAKQVIVAYSNVWTHCPFRPTSYNNGSV